MLEIWDNIFEKWKGEKESRASERGYQNEERQHKSHAYKDPLTNAKVTPKIDTRK